VAGGKTPKRPRRARLLVLSESAVSALTLLLIAARSVNLFR